jgi:hypothetical protein
MFAFFGLGTQELLRLAVLAVIFGGIALVAVLISRSSSRSSNRLAELEQENRRLREQSGGDRERRD